MRREIRRQIKRQEDAGKPHKCSHQAHYSLVSIASSIITGSENI